LKLARRRSRGAAHGPARKVVQELGGLDACNSFTKIYLSIFGQYDWEKCPVVPPELILLPDRSPISIYKMSSWSRAIVVPLSIISAYRPSCPVPEGAGIGELATPPGSPVRTRRPRSVRERGWATFFNVVDRMLHAFEKRGWTPLRRRALARAEAWILERLERSDGLGAIFPPIVNTILALRCRGYAADHPLVAGQVEELRALEIEEEETLRLQPCFSAVWDTALAVATLADAGMPADNPSLLRAATWLLDREVRTPGDWQRGIPGTEPGAGTSSTRTSSTRTPTTPPRSRRRSPRCAFPTRRRSGVAGAVERGAAWQIADAERDGGWPAFDRDCVTTRC
jgi:squalene-hopene/tetraprenyl-beta-curcumene cyclase